MDECNEHASELHTVTLETNGQHGGVDVVVKGEIQVGRFPDDFVDYERKYVVR